MFETLSPSSIKVVMFAQEEARKLKTSLVETEHILLGILKEANSSASKILAQKDIDFETIYEKIQLTSNIKISSNRFELQFSPSVKQAFEIANDEADRLGNEIVDPEHLLIGIINLGEGLAISLLKDHGINISRIRWHLLRMKNHGDSEENATPMLKKFTTDIIKKIEDGEAENILSRNEIVEEIIPYLSLYNKVYPLIMGKRGVGKSSLMLGVAQYILDGKIYSKLQNYRILEFDFNNLLNDSFEPHTINENFKEMINEIKQTKDVILVIDNIDNILKKHLLDSGLIPLFEQLISLDFFHCIAIAETQNYEEIFNHSSLSKYFHPIEIEESNIEETKIFLQKYKTKLVEHYNINVDEVAVETIIDYAKEYYQDDFLPKSAFKLMDLVMSKKKFSIILAQTKIKDMERHLRVLRNKREALLATNDLTALEKLKKEAHLYEEGIKILKNNISSNIRSTLTSGDVKLLMDKKFNGG